MTTLLAQLQELRFILVRLAAGQAGRYWNSGWRIFVSNFIAGTVVGAAASVLAALLLSIDAHRGADSLVYHAVDGAQTIVRTIQSQIERELH